MTEAAATVTLQPTSLASYCQISIIRQFQPFFLLLKKQRVSLRNTVKVEFLRGVSNTIKPLCTKKNFSPFVSLSLF